MIYETKLTKEKVNDILDDILDKISKYGINSITIHEKGFLDAYSSGDKQDVDNKVSVINNDIVFEDSYFKFELEETKKFEDEVHHIGTLYVPGLSPDPRTRIEGVLSGRIIVYQNGTYTIEFEKLNEFQNMDVYDFCEGLEYELDSFIDYIVQELE
jgi:hypothetical protein